MRLTGDVSAAEHQQRRHTQHYFPSLQRQMALRIAMPTNPFSIPNELPNERGVFGDARLIKKGFLYRVIELEKPFAMRFVYDGWWFRQTVKLNDHMAWSQISWLTIERNAEFKLPQEVSADRSPCKIEINFSKALLIQRFRIWINTELVYDEIL